MCVCVRACVLACVRACVRVCVCFEVSASAGIRASLRTPMFSNNQLLSLCLLTSFIVRRLLSVSACCMV